MQLEMTLTHAAGASPLTLEIDKLVIAGWTGRDVAAMEHHIQELEALGVKRPVTTPTFYHVAARRLTTAPFIECSGPDSSGEAEAVIFSQGSKLFVGLGSDHTDRKLEAYGIAISKQACDKPVAAEVWPFEEVAGHWDQLQLKSWLITDAGRVLYQEGSVGGLLAPGDLRARLEALEPLPDGLAIMGGTFAAIGGVRPGSRFECVLIDPVLSRRIELAYDIQELPIAG